MRRSAIVLVLVAAASCQMARANGFAHSPKYIAEANARAFRGEKPEVIARYLGHFSGGVVGGAVIALAEGGEKNLPLIKKLLKDTNPWIRGGAMRVLCAMYAPEGADGGKGPTTAPAMTPQLKAIMDLVVSMQDDPHPEVQAGIAAFFKALQIENPLVRRILIAQARDIEPSVRGRTVESIRHWIKDPATRVRVGREVLNRPEDVNPHALSLSARYLWENKDLARYTIPVLVKFLLDKAHTQRGFFTNGPYQRGLSLIEYYFDDKLEATEGLVQAVCRSVVRIPYSTYGGWMDARKTAERIIGKFSPKSAAAVRAAAAAEIEWLQSCTDDEIQAVTPADGKLDAREEALKRVKYLQDVAAWLAAGKPADRKPHLQHPQPKSKKPKKKPKPKPKKGKTPPKPKLPV